MPFSKDDENINRNGRPKKEWTWASLIEEEADKLLDKDKPNKGKVKKAITKALLKKAIDGDVQAFKEIANRTDGMPQQSVDMKVTLPEPMVDITKLKTDEILNNNSNSEDSEVREES